MNRFYVKNMSFRRLFEEKPRLPCQREWDFSEDLEMTPEQLRL